jgi:hypothetical protein
MAQYGWLMVEELALSPAPTHDSLRTVLVPQAAHKVGRSAHVFVCPRARSAPPFFSCHPPIGKHIRGFRFFQVYNYPTVNRVLI